MRKEKWWTRTAAALLAAVCCLGVFGPRALGAPEEARVVRIPYGISDLLRLDETGQPTGRYAAYLEKLAKENHWQYEYVEATWPQAVELLESGGLDLLFPTNYTEARAETMEFSTLVGGYTAPGLFARTDSGYSYEDFAGFNGARIAVTRGSSNEQALINFSQSRGFTYAPVYIESNDAKTQALAQGEVDMIILGANNGLSEAVLVSVMEASPFYLTVKKGNSELMAEVDNGMQRLVKEDPELVAETFRQCLFGENGSMLAYTQEEKDLIRSREPVVVGFYEGTEPLAYVNADGSYGGVYVKLLEYVRDNSGINLILQPVDRDTNWQDLISAGELDFFIGVSSSLSEEDPNYNTTDTFFPYDDVLITRSDCTLADLQNDPVIALTNGRVYLKDAVSSTMGAGGIRFYSSARECFLAVLRGEVDGTVVSNVEYNYQSKNNRFAELIQWENYRVTTEGGLMCGTGVDPVKFSAVNKAVSLLSEDFVNTTIADGQNMTYEPTLSDTLYLLRYPLMAVAAVVLAVIVVAVAIRQVRKRQRDMMEQVQAHERHQLRILAALSRDYEAIYYADLDADTCEEIRVNDHAVEGAGRIILASNHYWETMRNYIESFVQPEYYEALRPLSDRDASLQRFRERADFSVRYQVKPNDRGQEYFEIHLVDVSTDDKEHVMVFGIRCIDDVVRAETDQRQLLQNALEAANKASSAKSDFLSRMSHDIRTPMNAIIGMTAIAAAHLDDTERVKDSLGKIASSSRYLLGLINEVLDMSKIESGAITLSEEAFNLSDLLNNLLIMVQPQIKEHSHEFDVRIQDIQHEDVLGDSLRIQQTFVNIMGNAVKYTPDGGKLSLQVRELPSHSPKVAGYEFTFQDNGIGMTEEFKERIFEPFSRAEDVRVSKIQGTGLGMAIAQNIVQQMNGSIQVESEPGKGSTFIVTIYLKLQERQELDATELAELPVLVVDDDQDVCLSVCDLLDQIGMKSKGCTSGREGVEAVKETMGTPDQFYAAILDWKMPEMDGVETAKAIRKVAGDELPVIILSAYDWSDIEMEARAAGVDAFLSKPVFKSSLIRQFKALKNTEKASGETGRDELGGIRESDYSGARVLLVEDNDLNREIAKEIMEMAGLQVDEAENGKIAVDKVIASEHGYYKMIFMDIQMPIMSGYDAAMAIRSRGRPDSRSVPIIAMTANAFVEDVHAAKAAGMNEHLAKPIDFDKFNAILKKYLG